MPGGYGRRPPGFVWNALALARRRLWQFSAAFLSNANLPGFMQGTIYQGGSKALCLPGLNCYSCPGALGACPLGALQSALSGTVLRVPFYVLGCLVLMGILFGRMICGWLCPFGLIQELLFRLPGPKLRKGQWSVRLSQLKYLWGVLLILLLPLLLFVFTGVGEPLFCKYVCPAGTLEASVPLLTMNASLAAAAGWLTAWKFVLLGLFLLAMVFIYRPFCRFLCPLGAWYGLFNRSAVLGITVDAHRCTHCGRCSQFCGMDVKLAGDRECISCGECREICPVQAIHFRQSKNQSNQILEAKHL